MIANVKEILKKIINASCDFMVGALQGKFSFRQVQWP